MDKYDVILTRFSTDMQRTESCDDREREIRAALKRLGVPLPLHDSRSTPEMKAVERLHSGPALVGHAHTSDTAHALASTDYQHARRESIKRGRLAFAAAPQIQNISREYRGQTSHYLLWIEAKRQCPSFRRFHGGTRRIALQCTRITTFCQQNCFSLILCTIFLLTTATRVDGQVVRSSRFDAGAQSGVTFPPDEQFDPETPLTIEAWVYREDDARCETIVSHDNTQSFWLGFCPNLRFYRSGGTFADAMGTVPEKAWTHVAASYDGTTVRFYIDGQPAGTSALANTGGDHDIALDIGKSGNSLRMLGQLDEIRIWSVARTASQISLNQFDELRDEDGLVAVFAGGDATESINGLDGVAGAGVVPSPIGMLPRDLVIPRTPVGVTPTIDGKVNADLEYLGAERLVLRYRFPGMPQHAGDVTALLAHDDDYLYPNRSGRRCWR